MRLFCTPNSLHLDAKYHMESLQTGKIDIRDSLLAFFPHFWNSRSPNRKKHLPLKNAFFATSPPNIDLKDLWIGVLSEVEKQVTRPNLLTYFQHTAALGIGEDGVLVIGVPRQFFLSWHLDHSQEMIRDLAKKLDPKIESVVFRVDGSLEQG